MGVIAAAAATRERTVVGARPQIVYILSPPQRRGPVSPSNPLSIRLQLLGPVRLTSAAGQAAGPLLTQPRRLAIVVYLVMARPRGLQSRDSLMALLWPESDQSQGRHAVRNALHAIRQALGDDVIVTAGDDFVGVNHERITCDALAFEEDVRAQRYEQALARFDGELLQGFHVSNAPDFERWLDDERARLRDMAIAAAWGQADALRAAGDVEGTVRAARRAHSLAPDDERSFRRLLLALAIAGERGVALRAYREFAERLKMEYGVEPAVETQALMDRLPKAGASPPAPANIAHVFPAAVTLAAPTPLEEPTSRPHARSTGRTRALVGAAVIVALALISVLRASRPDGLRADDSTERPAWRDAVVLGDGLAERYRADTALFQRYLRAEALLQGDSYRPARDSFQAIVDGSPLYAPAWAGLSTAISYSGFNEMPPVDAMPLSLAAARRALALDSTLVHARSSVIAYDLAGRWDLTAAKRGLDAALANNPDDPQLNELLATWHRWRGELADAVELRRKIVRLNPLKPGYAVSLGWNLYLSHRCAEAVEVLRRVDMEFRATPNARGNLYKSYRCLGRTNDAAAALGAQLREQSDTALASLLDPPMSPTRRDSMLRVVIHAQLARSLDHRRHGWESSRNLASGYAELGDADSTLMWLDSMYIERSMRLHTVPFDPAFDFLHNDPRFQAFVAKLPWHPRVGELAPRSVAQAHVR